MLQIIVFSFNRAIQLDTLLTSFQKYWKNPSYKLDVIYNSSNEEFQKGYELLIDKMNINKNIQFHKESTHFDGYTCKEILGSLGNIFHYIKLPYVRKPKTNFRTLLIQLMENNTSKNVMFLTDDAMFIEDVYISPDIINWIEEAPFDRQFSLRIGKGMNNQPHNVQELENYLDWNLKDMPHMSNWGYRFSVDAHIYSKNVILKFFKKYVFVNPNSLEGYIESKIKNKDYLFHGRSFKQPKLLSFPINMVQTVDNNESLGVDCAQLNTQYLKGYELQYPIPNNINTFQVYPHMLFLTKKGEIKELKIE